MQGSGLVKLLVADCTSDLRIRGMASFDKPEGRALTERSLLGNGRLAEQGVPVIRNEMCNHEYRFDARAIEKLFHRTFREFGVRALIHATRSYLN